ncbi:MAG: hypothetical protein QM831_27130 [Kofleriaceae bacterium]
MKRTVSIFALIGLVGCFLPLQLGLSLFDLRHFDDGWHVWMAIAAFAIPAWVGATVKSDQAAGLVGLCSFGYLAWKFGFDTFKLLTHAASGGILMGIAIIGGIVVSLAALAGTQTEKA